MDTGDRAEQRFVVTDQDTAVAVGSGDVPVLGTPRLIAFMEAVTVQALRLGPGLTSVGSRVDVEHLRPSRVGDTVTVSAELVGIDGRAVRLAVAAHDDDGRPVGRGSVDRVVVDRERFLARLG